jgi:hypothetical protein
VDEEHGAVVEPPQEVLPAACEAEDPTSLQAGREIARDAAAQAALTEEHTHDATAGERARQRPDDGLYLGKLRHVG